MTDQNILVGQLEFKTDDDKESQLISRKDWDGESLYFDSGEQWVMRLGDLVTINIDAETTQPGFYVPIDSIYEDRGKTYVFAVESGKAKKIQVKVILPKTLDGDSKLRIESPELSDGLALIQQGVHFLVDGESIQVVESNPTTESNE